MFETNDRSLKWSSSREPIIVLLISGLTVIFFLAVAGLAKVYHHQQESIGDEFYARGAAYLKDGKLQNAVTEFRTALLYARDNLSYQLSLAQTLAAQHRTDEAYAYLLNLWQREPDNGTVNLELARILAAKGETNDAIRYYHNAVYAVWSNAREEQRRAVRLELVAFLLRANLKPQAQSELIALAANLPDDPALHAQVAGLFEQAEDYEHALAEYRQSLRQHREDADAMAGAGRAAFELGRYEQAQRYLQAAVTMNASETDSRALLETVTLTLQMDPFRRQLSSSRRNRIVIDAFQTAGLRLQACGGSAGPRPDDLESRWTQMKPKINIRGLHKDPDLTDAAMDLAFLIEQRSSEKCGAPTGKDLALLLISRLREGS